MRAARRATCSGTSRNSCSHRVATWSSGSVRAPHPTLLRWSRPSRRSCRDSGMDNCCKSAVNRCDTRCCDNDGVAGQLIVSISGISEQTLPDVAAFCEQLDERAVPSSLLVAPRLKGGYRLEEDASTVRWLTARRARGDAIVLHGFDEAATKKRRGEFATLPAHEANLRLMGADRVLEHLGLRTRIFGAPGWTVSQGTVDALPRNGFRLVAGLSGITDLMRRTTIRARVLGIGEGFL